MTDMAAQAEAHYAQQRAAERASLDRFLAWFRLQLALDDQQVEAVRCDRIWQVSDQDARQVEGLDGLKVLDDGGAMTPAVAAHIATWNPDRALSESDAKRTVLGYVVDDFADDDQYGHERVMDVLLPLAYVYRHQAGWDDTWTA